VLTFANVYCKLSNSKNDYKEVSKGKFVTLLMIPIYFLGTTKAIIFDMLQRGSENGGKTSSQIRHVGFHEKTHRNATHCFCGVHFFQ